MRVTEGDLVADGVEQVGFAQSRVAVNKQGVIQARGLRRHGDRRGVGKFVRRPHNKGVEGIVVIGVALETLLLRLAELLRDHKLHLQPRTEYLVEGLCEQGGIAPLQRLAVKVVGHLQDRRPLCEIERHRLDPADPCCEGHFRDAVFAKIADQAPGFGKGFHNVLTTFPLNFPHGPRSPRFGFWALLGIIYFIIAHSFLFDKSFCRRKTRAVLYFTCEKMGETGANLPVFRLKSFLFSKDQGKPVFFAAGAQKWVDRRREDPL